MKLGSDNSTSNISFPTVLSKMQSGSLFSKANLVNSLNPGELSNDKIEFDQAVSGLKSFKQYLLKFYKEIDFDQTLLDSAMNHIEYLFDLYTQVVQKGGWACANGSDQWGVISKQFGNMQASKLRSDYETYLFVLEKSFNSATKYDQVTVDMYLSEIKPSLMKSFEIYKPSMLTNEISSEAIQSYFFMDLICIPGLCGMMNLDLGLYANQSFSENSLMFSMDESLFLVQDLETLPRFYAECGLSTFPKGYSELSGRVPSALHWNSLKSLFRYSPETIGLSTPIIVLLKNSLTCLGGPSYNSITGVYISTQGQTEWWGINQNTIPSLQKKVQRDLNTDIFDGKWRPDEQYLLSNGIEFYYRIQSPGDVIISKTDTVYWIAGSSACLIYWCILPIPRISEVISSYSASKSTKHKFNLPRIATEYLNYELNSLTFEMTETLKKLVTDSIDEDSWNGIYTLETLDYNFCSVCGSDLVWRYGKCNLCLIETSINSLCLKCVKLHDCKEIQLLEKFSAVQFDKFYQRIQRKDEPSEVQIELNKVNVRLPETGCGESIKFESSGIFEDESYTNYPPPHTEEVLVYNPPASTDRAPAVIDFDECYKRKGKKKQKIREAMQNPINGPRFNYDYQVKKVEVFDIPKLDIPVSNTKKNNPLSSLVTNPKGTALSSLVSVSRKKELEQRKNNSISKSDRN
jgi:hypothetical protein